MLHQAFRGGRVPVQNDAIQCLADDGVVGMLDNGRQQVAVLFGSLLAAAGVGVALWWLARVRSFVVVIGILAAFLLVMGLAEGRGFLHAAGIGRGDIVQNCFGYHLTPAGMIFENGARAVGATVLPAGTGQTELQARAARDVGTTAYAGTPDYLKAILDKADEMGFALSIAKAAVSVCMVSVRPRAVCCRSLANSSE